MIFSLAKFYYDMKKRNKTFSEIKSNLSWANKCHGKIAKPRYDGVLCVSGYLVEGRWCRPRRTNKIWKKS